MLFFYIIYMKIEKNNTDNIEKIISFLEQFQNDWVIRERNNQNILVKEINSNLENHLEKVNFIFKEQKIYFNQIENNIKEIQSIITDKLQFSLNSHLGESFRVIENQLIFLHEGLGEMKILAKDVSSLNKILNNVKICGNFSEMQLSMLLQQILSPEQYSSNVITKSNTNYVVEFAIKLPGSGSGNIWLPIDVKFPKDTYEKVISAYDSGDKKKIDISIKNMESVVKKMSKNIQHKYIDPPNTTDFAILFLPFEGIYSIITKNSILLEELLKKYKVVITGPSTLAAILNSLQIGFRTLSIQKKTSEIWKVLESVKQEFSKFGILLNQAKYKLKGATKDIDKLIGVRSNVIEKKLRDIDK